MKEDKKFYYGTTTNITYEEYITPVYSDPLKALTRRRNVKVRVTDSLDSAKYYSNKQAEEKGGDPIIYEVLPDFRTLIKINKNEFVTQNAKIISVVENTV